MSRPRTSRRGLVAAVVGAPWLAWAAVRGLGLDLGHPLVAAMAFTPYAAASALLPVVLALALRAWVAAAVATVVALALVWAVAPRATDGPHLAREGADGRRLVVMTCNVLFGRADARAVVRLARERHVDVLSLQELTPEFVDRLDAAGIRRLLAGRVLSPRPWAAGSGLMARGALRRVTAREAQPFAQPEAELTIAGGVALRLKAVHAPPPVSSAGVTSWRTTLRDLPGPRAGTIPRLLLGDFNGTLDHREIRRLLDRGFYDAADATGDGLRATWPLARSRPTIAIDHVLAPEPIRTRRLSVHDVPGSDHRAVIAELVLP